MLGAAILWWSRKTDIQRWQQSEQIVKAQNGFGRKLRRKCDWYLLEDSIFAFVSGGKGSKVICGSCNENT